MGPAPVIQSVCNQGCQDTEFLLTTKALDSYIHTSERIYKFATAERLQTEQLRETPVEQTYREGFQVWEKVLSLPGTERVW